MWDITELVESVVEGLSRGDQVRMAAVCHAIWLIAAPAVWKDLPQQRWNLHIISILPHELADLSELPKFEGSLQVPPFPAFPLSTWERFFTHAQWIRSLRLVLDQADRANTELVLRVLRLGHLPLPLFPQLRQLVIQVNRFPPHLSDLNCLITPGLRELEINFFQDVNGYQAENPESFGHPAAVLLRRLTQHSSLRRLRCRAVSPLLGQLLGLSTELSTVITRHPQLVELELVNIEGAFLGPFAAASLLQDLSRMSFLPPSSPLTTAFPPQLSLSNHPFPAIEGLEIAVAADHVATVLSSISSAQVRRLEILVQTRHLSEIDLAPGILHDVPRFTTLTMVSLHLVTHIAQWLDLKPLLSCSRLTTVELGGPRLSDVVGNKELESMARSWTDLQQLLIRDDSRYPPSNRRSTINVAVKAPLATLDGLYPFAVHCPSMRELEISVDASSIGEQAVTSHSLSCHATQFLRLPCSFVGDNVDAVAEYILTMWPNLQLEDYRDDPYEGSKNEVTARMGERWARIWEQVDEVCEYD